MLRLPIWGAHFEEQHPGPSWMVTPRSSHWGDSVASLVPAHPLPAYLFAADSSELVLSIARNPWETSASAPSFQAKLAAELGWVLGESGGVRKAPCICLAKWVIAPQTWLRPWHLTQPLPARSLTKCLDLASDLLHPSGRGRVMPPLDEELCACLTWRLQSHVCPPHLTMDSPRE